MITWREFLEQADADGEAGRLRRNTHSGRPLGTADFVKALEQTLHRKLAPQRGGRPHKREDDPAQTSLSFG